MLEPPPARRTRNVLERRKNQCVLWIRFLRSLRRFGIGVGHIIVYCCSSACVCRLGDIRFKCSEVTRTCTIVSDDGRPEWAEEIKFLVSRSEGRRDIDSFSARYVTAQTARAFYVTASARLNAKLNFITSHWWLRPCSECQLDQLDLSFSAFRWCLWPRLWKQQANKWYGNEA